MVKKTVIAKNPGTAIEDPQENAWRGLYVISEHWRSDLQFFSDELRFLRSLMDKYFIWLIDEKNIEHTRSVAGKLVSLEKRRFTLEQKVADHLSHLTNFIENPFPHDGHLYQLEHGELERALGDFVKDYRSLKKEIFQLTEDVIDSEKTRHMLGID